MRGASPPTYSAESPSTEMFVISAFHSRSEAMPVTGEMLLRRVPAVHGPGNEESAPRLDRRSGDPEQFDTLFLGRAADVVLAAHLQLRCGIHSPRNGIRVHVR